MAKVLMGEQTTENELRDVLNESVVLSLIEGKDEKSGKLFVRGEFGHAEKPTANGRLYPPKLWETQIDRLSTALKGKKVLGELDHPSDGRTSLQRASHVITDLKLEDGRVIGEAEILDTAKGRDLKAIFQAGVPVGISSRGYGSTKTDSKGNEVVQEDYKLVTFDFVAEPADSTAYPEAFFEGVEFPMKDDKAKEKELEAKFAKQMLGVDTESKMSEAEVSAMRTEISDQLIQVIKAQRVEVEKEVREGLLADPAVAGAKTALESILATVKPFMLSEDVASVVEERDEEIGKLKTKLAEQDLKISEKDEVIDTLSKAVKEAGYKFHMERQIEQDDDADLIRESVGDVTSYDSTKALDEAIDGVKSKVEARRDEERQVQEVQLAEESRLKAKTTQLADGLEDALLLNQTLALELYAEKRLRNHAQADQIRSVLEHTSLSSQEQVDDLLEKFREPERDVADLESIRDRVRSKLGSGRESLPESRQERRRGGTKANYNGLGSSLNELRSLSGLPDKG